MAKNTGLYRTLIALGIFIGCEDRTELSPPVAAPVNTGSANFATYIALGNSLTAGYQSAALYESGQRYSYGNLIAQQAGTQFVQPLISDPGSGGRLEISEISPTSATIKTNLLKGTPKNQDYAKPYNNLGIPGAFVSDVLTTKDTLSTYTKPKYGFLSVPLANMILRGKGTMIAQAKALIPTFVTLWIGNNDILFHAVGGATGTPFTPVTEFQQYFNALAESLATLNAKVVVANVPNVTSIPLFSYITKYLKAQGFQRLYVVRGTNDTALVDLNSVLLTLNAAAYLGSGAGLTVANPLPNSVVIDSAELVTIKSVIGSYNSIIASAAAAKGFQLLDANKLFDEIAQNGVTMNGIKFTTEYVTGGLFSLDGIHPTSRGYGVVANFFIDFINLKFNAGIPRVNVSTIPSSLILGKYTRQNELGLPIFEEHALDNLVF